MPAPATPARLSEPADPVEVRPDDAVEVGRVIGAWGVKGGIKVQPFSADPQALFSSKRWYLERSEAKPAQRVPALLRVRTAREQGDTVVATCEGLDDRGAAELLAGARIFVARASFPTPDEDEFYWVDLIGLSVKNREGLMLGVVAGLVETGPHCVLRVRPADGGADPNAEEVLIPFVAAYVDGVDREARIIAVDWQPDY